MELFDTHSHYNDEAFDNDREEIIKNTYKAGITKFTCIGYDLDSSKKAIDIAKGIIGHTILLVDLGFVSLLNRSLQLTDGFIAMIKIRNLTCAGALLRLQLDNCMRLYALYIAEDRNIFVKNLMNGEKIDRLKDKDGKQMKDYYLKQELTKLDTQFSKVYENSSG